MDTFNIEEYIPRPRCNTWPIQQQKSNNNTEVQKPKSGGRKNPWGNQSYAELITQAIYSSPERRMTLAQIYGWIIENVPYFSQRTDNKSSAGWKNSVRHNLSLHNRFMKIQNDVQGRPSWWIINPSSPNTKTRKRAASLSNNCEGIRLKSKSRIDQVTFNIQQIKSYLQTPDLSGDFTHDYYMQQQPIEQIWNHQVVPDTNNADQQIDNFENIHEYFANFNIISQQNDNDTLFDQNQLETLNDIQEIIDRDQNLSYFQL